VARIYASNIPQSKNVLQIDFLLVEIEGIEQVLLISSTILVYASLAFGMRDGWTLRIGEKDTSTAC
jgi:hypothetical protein